MVVRIEPLIEVRQAYRRMRQVGVNDSSPEMNNSERASGSEFWLRTIQEQTFRQWISNQEVSSESLNLWFL